MNDLTLEGQDECNCIGLEEAYEIGQLMRTVDDRIVVLLMRWSGNDSSNSLPLAEGVDIVVVSPVKN